MSEDGRGILVLVILVGALGLFMGGLMTRSTFRLDTFDCTKKCDGTHSIQFNNLCYCEKE